MKRILSLPVVVTLLVLGTDSTRAQLAGHGGPVRAIAISADGKSVVSGSFDTAAIRWSLASQSAEQVLRFHADAVNAVAFLKDGRVATAGADGADTGAASASDDNVIDAEYVDVEDEEKK